MPQRRKLKIKRKQWLIPLLITALIFTGISLFFSPFATRKPISSAENTYKMHCGSCHLVPDPKNIPKSFWKKNVLPEMAARMGFGNAGNRPDYYPKEPTVDSAQWRQIEDYVLDLAPDSVPNFPKRQERSVKLAQFKTSFRVVAGLKASGAVVNVSYDASKKTLFVGNFYGRISDLNNNFSVKTAFGSPVVSTVWNQDTLYITEIGILQPSEKAEGTLYSMAKDSVIPIYEKLHRPVFSHIEDLNEDGKNEIIICEFGNHTGALSLLEKKGAGYEKKELLGLPGSIKVEVVDMDKDGKKDIVALFSQGREGVYIFYQKENLEFDVAQVIAMGPEYGSSWFDLVDYDGDGDLDLVLANGDNADYSSFLKPYHGIRLFMNEGNNEFVQKWFYPINGATRVLAADFDRDGDIDFAVSAFFLDFENNPKEGFVYLENKNAAKYEFSAQTTEKAANGNWLVMEKGDFDADGDIDLLLGNFNLLTADKLKGSTNDLLYLENKAVEN